MGLFDRLRGNDTPRVAFIGIDGVPHSLLSSHFDEFEHLSALATDGTAGPIDSIIPPESSACWPAVTTGKNPGKTGVYGFQDRETGSYDTYVPMGEDVQAERVWTSVHEAGGNATVMNVPVTFPPQRELQRMVSGFLSPDLDRAAHPDSLREFLRSINYRIDVDATLGHNVDKTDFINDAHATIDTRMEAFRRFLKADDWDLFFGVFMTPDRVNHFLFDQYEQEGEYYEEFMDFYRKLDEYIGEIRNLLPEEVTLIVASDHGFTTLDYEVNLNAWLKEEGWLSYRSDDPETLDDISDDTRAYSLAPGRFYLNLEGREPRGTVPPSEYDAVRDELAASLRSLTGPNGEPVCKRVIETEDAFRGPHDAIAPDLTIIPEHGFDLKAEFHGDEIFRTGPRTGMHTFDNATFFIDKPDADLADVDLFDITPTILSILDIDFDRPDYDGVSVV